MKLVLLSLLLLVLQVNAQQNPISAITISLPPNPDPIITNWKGGTSLLTISAAARAVNGRPDVRLEGSRILVVIKKAGSKTCGSFNSNSAPAANFTTLNKVWSGNTAVSLIGQDCTLPPGDYELCVQLFGDGPRGFEPISEEKCKTFTIKGNEQQSYQPPQPMLPANGTIFKEDEIKKPVTFRWTPVVPRPQDPVTYRLRVWRMAEGQNSISATIIQQPILGNEVGNVTQAIVRLNTTSPNSNSPEIYVWNVQALNRDGKPIGSNNGTSEAFTITVQPVNDAPVVIKLVSPANRSIFSANDKIRFNWSINNSGSTITHYKLKIAEILLNQSPYEALRTNKPHFEKDSLRELSLVTPSAFVSGKRYAWYVEAKGERGVKITESEINEFIISPVSASPKRLTLVSPGNGETLSLQHPTFSWTLDLDGDGYYKIKIVEIKGDQSPEQAMRGNKPHFEKDSLPYFKGNKPHFEKDSLKSFQYPSAAPKLEAGKRYAWNISCEECTDEPNHVRGKKLTSETFAFTVPPIAANGQRISLISPANNTVLDTDPLFSWTPITGDYDGDGYYKIKIVEIKGDESPDNALRTNKPFFEKDSLHYFKGNKPHFEKDSVNWMLSFQYPSSAPKLIKGKNYAWQVQVLNKEGNFLGRNGTSDSWRFSKGESDQQKSTGTNNVFSSFISSATFPCIGIQLKAILVSCQPVNQDSNQYLFNLEITYSPSSGYIYPTFNDSTSGIRFTGLASPNTVYTTLRPNLNINSNWGTITIPYSINVVMPAGANGLTISFLADDMGIKPVVCRPALPPIIIATLPPCSCNPCVGKQTEFGIRGSLPQITSENNGLVSVSAAVTHTPVKVIKISTQIVDVQRQGESGCLSCTKESSAFGNITAGMLNNNAGIIAKGSKGYGKLIEWKFSSPKAVQNLNYTLQMLFPPLNAVGCCKDSIKICIRWSFTDENNITCDTLICNTIIREYKKQVFRPDASLVYAELVAPMGSPYTDWYNQDNDELPPTYKSQLEALWQKREQEREVKIEKGEFEENIKSIFLSLRNLKLTGTDLRLDIEKFRIWNTQCGSGDFETGEIDMNEWSGAAGTLESANSPYNFPDFNPLPVGQNLPIDVITNNHSIVTHQNDPIVGALLKTTSSTSSLYAFRLGNRAALNVINNGPSFKGGDILAKRFIVTGNGIINFKYALVMEGSSHSVSQKPYFAVRVYNANGLPIHNAVYLNPSASTPSPVIYSENGGTFFQHTTFIPGISNINYRGWTSAKIDLSQFIGQEVRVVFLTASCFVGGHFGYAYIDDWNGNCNTPPDAGPITNCNEFKKQVTSQVAILNKNAVKIAATFKAGPKPVKQIRISVANFETSSKSTECLTCIPATSGTMSVPQSLTGSGKDAIEGMVYPTLPVIATCVGCPAIWSNRLSSEVTWGSMNGKGYDLMDGAGDQSTTFTIQLPKKSALSCCDDTIKICIRYSFTDIDCRTCDTIICYKIINRTTSTQPTEKSLTNNTTKKVNVYNTEKKQIASNEINMDRQQQKSGTGKSGKTKTRADHFATLRKDEIAIF